MTTRNLTYKILAAFFLFALLSNNSLIGQNKVDIDSLENLLDSKIQDTTRVNILPVVASYYITRDIEKSLKQTKELLTLSQKLKDNLNIGNAYNLLGDIANYKNDDFVKVITYYEQSLYYYKKAKNPNKELLVLSDMGVTYSNASKSKEAVNLYLKALRLSQEIKDTIQIIHSLNSIGVVFFRQEDYPKAQEYFTKSRSFAEKINFLPLIASTNMNIGNVYSRENKNDSALVFYYKSLEIKRKVASPTELLNNLNNIANIYVKKEQYDSALVYANEYYQIAQEANYSYGIGSALFSLGNIFFHQEQYKKSLTCALEGLELVKGNADIYKLRDLYGLISINYEKLGNYRLAYENTLKYQDLGDSINKQETREFTDELMIQYETKEKEQLLALQNVELSKKTLQRNLSMGLAVAFLLIAGLALMYYKQKRDYSHLLEQKVAERTAELQQANKKLEQSNEELEQFTYITSHDLKEPLRNVVSFVNLIKRRNLVQNDTALEYFEFIERGANQMNNIVKDVLEFSGLRKMDVTLEGVSIEEIIRNTQNTLRDIIHQKNAEIKWDNIPPEIQSNQSMLFLIFKNLIENGIKYNNSHPPIIQINYETEDSKHIFKISDNGIGIDPAYHQLIFKMFKRLHDRSKYNGSGIGLATCRKMINYLNGEIEVRSEEGKGSTFIVKLPQ